MSRVVALDVNAHRASAIARKSLGTTSHSVPRSFPDGTECRRGTPVGRDQKVEDCLSGNGKSGLENDGKACGGWLREKRPRRFFRGAMLARCAIATLPSQSKMMTRRGEDRYGFLGIAARLAGVRPRLQLNVPLAKRQIQFEMDRCLLKMRQGRGACRVRVARTDRFVNGDMLALHGLR
jgi:hypothetical protein